CVGEGGPCLPEDLCELGRVRAREYRLEILPVHVRVGPTRGREVLRGARRGMFGLEIHHEADLVLPLGAVRLHGHAVGAQQVVAHTWRLDQAPMPWGEGPMQVPA